jgi:carbon-monoxide dehydrogenase medium subunit
VQVPAPFEYERATSVDHALALLEQLGPESRLIAGGHSLLPMMKLRLAAPEHVIDINDLGDLSYIRVEGDEVRIGALTRHRDVLASEILGRRLPIFADAERVVADPVVRNRGTVGGSLCQADPAEDLSAVCVAVGAKAVIRGKTGGRVVGLDAFQTGPYETAVGPAEMLVEVRVPLHDRAGSAYEKVERRTGDWAIAAVGASIWLEGDAIADAGIGLAALGPRTIRAVAAEDALRGNPPSEELFARAADAAAEASAPAADQRGPVDYKRHLARELTLRALRHATARARRQEV